ncbi:MAG: glycosyltransferase [Thiomicrorhabdus sp.]|jgi:glycosyltransferase involved in cell wall biosynthesis|nr:glycosyltransferase [Thiomicrorhabdus sp.]
MKVLFLAYYFPPESSSGSFRPLFFANHLSDLGCTVQVVTARVDNYLDGQPKDQNLLKKLNSQVIVNRSAVIRPREALIRLRDRLFRKTNHEASSLSSVVNNTPSSSAGWFQPLKDSVTDLLSTPDPQVGWIWSSVRVGKKIIQRGEADIIWATGSPWSGLVAGALLKKMTRKPLVLDFRDPWVSNPNFLRRSVMVKFIDRVLEKFVVKNADLIIANTEELQEDFQQRYRSLPNLKVTSITNGFEEYLPSVRQSSNEPLTITHTGALYFSRNPVELLEAVSNLLAAGVIKPSDLRLQFVGGIDIDDPRIEHLLGQPDMQTVVVILPRVSYDEVQQYVCQSDVLLMIQPDFPLQVPRKLYEYMAAGKPMLCLSETEGATAGMMSRFKLGYLCENKANQIERTLLQIYQDWQSQSLPDLNDSRCDACLNRNLSAALCQALQEIYEPVTSCGAVCE